MAQTGFTPISLYYTTTASAAPTAGNLVAGELAINTNDGKLFYKDSAGAVQVIGTKGGVGSSSTTQALYNSSGLVTGSSTFTYSTTSGLSANGLNLGYNTTLYSVDGALSNYSAANGVYLTGNAAGWLGLAASGTQATNIRLYGTTVNTNIIAFTNAGAESMRIDSSGNLNLGQSSGSNGASKLGIANDCGVQAMGIWTNTASGTATQNILLFYRNASLSGYIQASSTGVNYATSSDYRLKENIAPMTGALNVVQKLNPVTYNWKVDGSRGQGFIAHELSEVVPDCVSGEKDAVDSEGKPVYQGIDTSFLVATLTAAIQELKAELDSVKAELQTLKGN